MHEPVQPMRRKGRTGPHGRGWVAWAAASAACVLAAALAVVSVTRQAGQVNTRPSAEIYFNNSSDIAKWGNAKSMTFSFVVHNLVSKTHDYLYEIDVSGKEGQPAVVADKVLTLKPQQRVTIRETLKPPNSARFRVTVSLSGTNTSIFFWTQAPSARTAGSKH
jgi:hypothetical protein